MSPDCKMFTLLIAAITIALCHSSTSTPSVTSCIIRDKYVDCSNLDLKSVPVDIPENTETLILHNISITRLNPGVFSKYPNLLYLDLSYNNLKKLHKALFKGVHRLQTLDLSHNNELPLDYFGFPVGLFRPLGRSLETLRFNLGKRIVPITAYPDKSIADLYNLRYLMISMFTDVTFGPGFANLTKLKELERGSTCNIDALHNSTFNNFRNSQLQSIRMGFCSIYDIEPGTFSGLPSLQFLDLARNFDLGLDVALDSLGPLEHQRLKEVLFSWVNTGSNTALDRTMWLKLKNICVETLDISNNLIVALEFSAIAMLKHPECYKTLRIASHLVANFPPSMLIFLPFLTNLTELDISGRVPFAIRQRQRRMSGSWYPDNSNSNQASPRIFDILLPPALRILNFSYAIGSNSGVDYRVILRNAEKLEILDIAYNGIHSCYFSAEGLTNLKNFNISYSDCSDLKPEFLFGYGNLTALSFRGANLAKGLSNDPEGIFLSKLIHLEYLDLCCNGFIKIHDDLLHQNKKIGSINLSNNKLQNIPETVLMSETLHHLDMSFNVLSSLNEEERQTLDNRVRSDIPFSLKLNGNPFICSCSTIDFLEWLANTHVTLDKSGNYSCFLDNGTQTSTSYQITRLHELRIQCVSDFWLRLSVICCGLALLAMVVSAFGYRYRWNIKYWFLTRCTGRQVLTPEPHFDYDVFVAYNHEDYEWVCGPLRTFLEETGPHKYRLCLHHRDFPVGQSIQSNIVSAMNDSRKIILVLTTQFLTCTWGEYEMEIAAMRDVSGPHSGDGVIIAVLLDDVPTRLMPRVLLNMWRKMTFLVWSQDPLDKQMFWNRLVEAIDR